MPTYRDATVDADQTREALRGLAHATQRIIEPADTYQVLGSLSAALLSLRQSLDQLAGLHERYALRATSDQGDRRGGRRDALAAGEHLRAAAGSVRRAHGELRAAFNHNGQIAWQQGIDATLTRRGQAEPDRRAPASAVRIHSTVRPDAGSLGR